MHYVSLEISLIALLPALFLCGYIYYKDRIEREPIGLLALLFCAGAVVCLPVLLLEKWISGIIDLLFAGQITFSADGVRQYSSQAASALHKILCAFIAVALVEVGVKWCILYFCTYKNKHFNYLFDGIVYSVFISLGFAAVENVRFAWINGWDTLLLHSLASVPCHLFVGILMGYYYTIWKAHRNADKQEEVLLARGVITGEKFKTTAHRLLLSLLVPMLASGVCMAASSVDSAALNTLFYFFVFMLYGMSFIGIDKIASRDSAAGRFSTKLVQKMHPEADPSVWEEGMAETGNPDYEGDDADRASAKEDKR